MTPNQKKWLAALRSGDYEQGTKNLNCDDKFCCLGVAADIFKDETVEITEDKSLGSDGNFVTTTSYNNSSAIAPNYVVDALGLYSADGLPKNHGSIAPLTVLNDIYNKSFNDIADIIESDPSEYFSKTE